VHVFASNGNNIHKKEAGFMKRISTAITVLFVLFLLLPMVVQAAPTANKYPCSLVLDAAQNMPINAKGAALAYVIKRDTGMDRTSLSIHAQYLPSPSSLGDYDRYEGFAEVPGEISWRFTLLPVTLPGTDIPIWSGRIDDITGPLERAVVQVRLSNSRTDKLGPIVLEKNMNQCH
jgi:hypothetical protein